MEFSPELATCTSHCRHGNPRARHCHCHLSLGPGRSFPRRALHHTGSLHTRSASLAWSWWLVDGDGAVLQLRTHGRGQHGLVLAPGLHLHALG